MNTNTKTTKIRFAAIIIAFTMLVSLFGGISFAPITTYAATITLEKGAVVKIGDSIDFGDSYLKDAICIKYRNGTPWKMSRTGECILSSFRYSEEKDDWEFEFAEDGEPRGTIIGVNGDKDFNPDGFIVSGGTGSEIDPYTFELHYAAYSITISNVPENGSISVNNKAAEGEIVEIDVTPDTDYEIDTVSYSDGSDHIITPENGVYTFIMPASDVTVSVTFKKAVGSDTDGSLVGTVVKVGDIINVIDEYIEYAPNQSGKASANLKLSDVRFDKEQSGWIFAFDDGTTILIVGDENIIPDGFEVSGGTGIETDTYTFSLHYPTYNITIPNAPENGSISVNNKAIEGEKVEIYVTPDTDYEIDTVSYNDGSDHVITPEDGVYSFIMPSSDVTVSVTFKVKVTPTPSKSSHSGGGGGGGSVTTYKITYDLDGGKIDQTNPTTYTSTTKKFTLINPTKEGYSFVGWTGTDLEEATTTVTLTKGSKGNRSYKANWEEIKEVVESIEPEEKESLLFIDVPNDSWYHDSVYYVANKKIMFGTEEKIFSPDMTLTRGMLVTLLYRLHYDSDTYDELTFRDVSKEMYYYEPLQWAHALGIASGYSNTEFGPDNEISREQFVAMLYRFANYMGYDVKSSEESIVTKFRDYKSISKYAMISMEWAVKNNLIQGKTENVIDPLSKLTRCEAAAIIERFIKNFSK